MVRVNNKMLRTLINYSFLNFYALTEIFVVEFPIFEVIGNLKNKLCYCSDEKFLTCLFREKRIFNV